MTTFWETMGLAGKRAIIVHHEDLGATKEQNEAFRALPYPSGSVLVPAHHIEELAANARPDADLGVHLMLSADPPDVIRPLTSGPSLQRPDAGFWRTRSEAWMNIKPKEAEAEMKAQIERALALGIDVTHIDSHMAVALRPDLAKIYLKLALRYRVPPFIAVNIDFSGLPGMWQGMIRGVLSRYLPLVNFVDGYWVAPDQKKDWYISSLSKLGPGVYLFRHHSALPSPTEPKPPDAESREADFAALSDPDLQKVLATFQPVTYREIRDAFRKLR